MIPSRLSPDLHPRPFCFVAFRVHDGVPVRGSWHPPVFAGLHVERASEIPDPRHGRFREILGLGG